MDDERAEALAQFMAITSTEADVAMNMLEAADYNLESAVNLFFTAGPTGAAAAAGAGAGAGNGDGSAPMETDEDVARRLQEESYAAPGAADEVRMADAVRTERLYDEGHLRAMHRQASLQEPPPHAMDAFRDFSTEEAPEMSIAQQGLADLFKAPKELMYHGNWESAKHDAAESNKWLLANIQSNEEFASHQLNRDTWANDAVQTMLKTFFMFWQTYDISEAGQKICGFYKLVQFPAIMVVDPITGACLAQWHGYLSPEQLLEKLEPFLNSTPEDGGPKLTTMRKKPSQPLAAPSKPMTEDEEIARAMALSMADAQADGAGPSGTAAPEAGAQPEADTSANADDIMAKALADLPAEPEPGNPEGNRIAIRLPDGQRVQRRFLKSDTVKAVRDFCIVSLPEAATGRPFSLKPAFPGSQELADTAQTLQAAGAMGAMVVMSWSA